MKACVLLFLSGCIATAQAPPSTATLDGDVVDQDGRPIAAAAIELRGVSPFTNTASDAGGHFQFTNLRAGPYVLDASRPGFLRLNGRLITVKPGENIAGIRITLTRQGVISGKVTDDGGWPAANARVTALRYETSEGTRQLHDVGSAETDDLGRYRLTRLPAGRYYVQAEPGSKLSNWDKRNAPAYYPSAFDVSEAKTAAVEAGDVTAGIDIKLARIEGVDITGRVVAPSRTAIPPGFPVMILHEHPAGVLSSRGPDFMRDGSFTFRHVRPGTYTLRAGAGSFLSGSALDDSGLGAQQKLVVGDRDIVGVELVLRPSAFDVSGKVIFEGKTETASITVLLNSTSGRSSFTAKTNADGTFVIKGVAPGRYRISLWSPTAFVKSVRFGDKEALDYLDLDGASAGSLEITMSSGLVKVEGVVSDATGAPAQQAFVAFMGKSVPARYSRVVTPADQTGHFSVESLVPGQYSVLAISDANLLHLVVDTEFQKANANFMKTVTLAEGNNPPLALVTTSH